MPMRRCGGCQQLYLAPGNFKPFNITVDHTHGRWAYGFGRKECRDKYIATLDPKNRELLTRLCAEGDASRSASCFS